MKKTILSITLLAVALGIISCHKKGELPPQMQLDSRLIKDTTKIEFIDPATFQFDTINQGDKVEHSFRIKNTGEKNLIIVNAFGSCGCTVPEYPKEPVKPGDIATIHVTFNSAGKENQQDKSVTLVCNTDKRNEMLYLKGFVKTKE